MIMMRAADDDECDAAGADECWLMTGDTRGPLAWLASPRALDSQFEPPVNERVMFIAGAKSPQAARW